MREKATILFSEHDLSAVIAAHDRKMIEAINAIEANRLLNTSIDDLCDYFEQEYRIDVPIIKDAEITVDHEEVEVDISRDPTRAIFDRSEPYFVRGTAITYHVPFDGDSVLFKCRPSHFTLNPPWAQLEEHELIMTFKVLDQKPEAIKSEFGRNLADIRTWLEWVSEGVKPHNASLRQNIRGRIESRRDKLLRDQGLVASLGYPLKHRPNAPQTYSAPQVRRKLPPMPKASTAPFVPEPAMDMKEYEHILSVVSNMVAVMERSPHAFKEMKEEDLRQHFLVQLNGQYDGQATGETFNFEGKTDILIRVNGRNIFIAECMYWNGPKSLEEKLDQLLGYASWRDTKKAIFVFNRTKSFSGVLEKIPGILKGHANFKRQVECVGESATRYILNHRDDKNRELTVTILAFEVPT